MKPQAAYRAISEPSRPGSNSAAAVYGRVASAGTPVPDGTVVEGRVGDTVCGTTATYTAGGESWYQAFVSPDSDTPGCGTPGAATELYVDGVATGSVPWLPGVQFLDLVAARTQASLTSAPATPLPQQPFPALPAPVTQASLAEPGEAVRRTG